MLSLKRNTENLDWDKVEMKKFCLAKNPDRENCTLRWPTKPAREFQSLSQNPSVFFFPTLFPTCTKSTKYVEVEGYKSPPSLCLGLRPLENNVWVHQCWINLKSSKVSECHLVLPPGFRPGSCNNPTLNVKSQDTRRRNNGQWIIFDKD